jgi:hypothetical protein
MIVGYKAAYIAARRAAQERQGNARWAGRWHPGVKEHPTLYGWCYRYGSSAERMLFKSITGSGVSRGEG